MKNFSKILVLIFSSLLIFCLSACASETSSDSSSAQSAQQTAEQGTTDNGQPDSGSKILIAYFSCTGNTENAAEQIATETGGDLYAITPAQPYTADDLRYNDDTTRATKEQHDPDARPAISGSIDNFQQYDVIFIGYPIWWDQAPRVINTFLESYDFSGKKVALFCTSGGSGIENSENQLKSLYNNITWLDGMRLRSGSSQSDISSWIDSLNIK